MTMRPEMPHLAQRRALNVQEFAELPKLLAGLLETNIAPQRPAQQVAKFVADRSTRRSSRHRSQDRALR